MDRIIGVLNSNIKSCKCDQFTANFRYKIRQPVPLPYFGLNLKGIKKDPQLNSHGSGRYKGKVKGVPGLNAKLL